MIHLFHLVSPGPKVLIFPGPGGSFPAGSHAHACDVKRYTCLAFRMIGAAG